jgi:hypothetical protein
MPELQKVVLESVDISTDDLVEQVAAALRKGAMMHVKVRGGSVVSTAGLLAWTSGAEVAMSI